MISLSLKAKRNIDRSSHAAFTLRELVILVTVFGVIAAMLVSAILKSRQHDFRVECVNNVKRIGMAFRVWIGDQGDRYPMQVAEKFGGSQESGFGAKMFRHFEVMSNELNSPKVLFCPSESDRWRTSADYFRFAPHRPGETPFLSNTNVSYFIGLDAADIFPQMLLTGDHNLTNGTAVDHGLLVLSTNRPAGWTREMHQLQGNVGLADGSVQSLSTQGLRNALGQTGFETNRLAMP